MLRSQLAFDNFRRQEQWHERTALCEKRLANSNVADNSATFTNECLKQSE
jgi:hypothetical protein